MGVGGGGGGTASTRSVLPRLYTRLIGLAVRLYVIFFYNLPLVARNTAGFEQNSCLLHTITLVTAIKMTIA